MAFIDDMRAAGHAVESTCRVLTEHGCQVAARTYRAWKQAGRPIADPNRSRRGRSSTRCWPSRAPPKGSTAAGR